STKVRSCDRSVFASQWSALTLVRAAQEDSSPHPRPGDCGTKSKIYPRFFEGFPFKINGTTIQPVLMPAGWLKKTP
ncbi:hypothetical protein, partial [Paraburkholderia aspalathi]|uniref:hypothetical protein n=1 Tax=Paraburkholderia aspalathi TaxID=1324617 RepID=UPI001BA96BCE